MDNEKEIKRLKAEETLKFQETFKDNEPNVDERLRFLKGWTVINSLALALFVGVTLFLVTKLITLQAQVQQFTNESDEPGLIPEEDAIDSGSSPQLLLSEEVHYCCGQRGEQSPINLYYEKEIFVEDSFEIEIQIGEGACSDLKFYVYVDGKLEAQSDFIGGLVNLTTTGPMRINNLSSGMHRFQIRPEGRADVAGCNVGTLNSWGGTISFYAVTTSSP